MRQPIHLLLVEDNPGDAKLAHLALERAGSPDTMSVVNDGVDAWRYLRKETPFVDARRPDLVLLNLNLPRMNGREMLQFVKTEPGLRRIPVVMLTSSEAAHDIEGSYGLHANYLITKPTEPKLFIAVGRSVVDFGGSAARLPHA